jgi:putative IMPACT (imprinted ancient) family translation regulator
VSRPDGADGSPPAEAQRHLDTIAEQVRVEQVVTRSRFIATLAPVVDEAAADATIAAVRNEFHDARHHCTAMVLGPDGQRQRSNDDGEPAGTAGAPMLAVLRGAEVTDVVAVVTRYFGGTLLGAGGLVRAYGGAVTAALAEAQRVARVPVARFELASSHPGRRQAGAPHPDLGGGARGSRGRGRLHRGRGALAGGRPAAGGGRAPCAARRQRRGAPPRRARRRPSRGGAPTVSEPPPAASPSYRAARLEAS